MTQSRRQDNVVSLKADPVFFAKHQLRVGTPIRFVGRTANSTNSLWFVTKIWTTDQGQIKATTFPRTLSDLVELTNHQTKERKLLTFAYLSYSAIWRIEG